MSELTQSRLKELLHYDPSTGFFTRLVTIGGQVAGTVAGTPNCDGYVQISIDRRFYLAHRLAYLYMTGLWPVAETDHKDLDKKNNVWSNLRPATALQNSTNKSAYRNNLLGLKGVSADKNMFSARIRIDGKNRYLGSYATPEEAHTAYMNAAICHFGEFARG